MAITKSSFPEEKPSDFGKNISLKDHLVFTFASMLLLMVMYSILRLALLIYNSEKIGTASAEVIAEAFFNGLRFDLRLTVLGCVPLLFAILSERMLKMRRLWRCWLSLFASLTLFFGLIELDFYREFNQRLNGLVFQYLKEDPKTVLSMLWFGFPVLRYLFVWVAFSWLLVVLFKKLDSVTRQPVKSHQLVSRWHVRTLTFVCCLSVFTVAARGTLRQGPPLRWGDAFTTESIFANELGLNGTLSLAAAAQNQLSPHRNNIWSSNLPLTESLTAVRGMLLTKNDTLVDKEQTAILRDYHPPSDKVLPIRNVVLILMESFAGHSVGALGAEDGVTPYFDKLASEGVLFTRFFSNGTHTHQGMFASISCFPNLPGFEYLMQTPEGSHNFSGLPVLLNSRGFSNLYVYNGDFSWDNQLGFFGGQGVSNFIGRSDFVNPVVFDRTWGVSDQDMFARAATELEKNQGNKPFYALLQTLSNHTPYALPEKLPVKIVENRGSLNQHLTAMRYSDWALGQFFEKARGAPYFKETLFVIVGDHGFSDNHQLTEMHLARFHVPLLLIGPGIQEKFGKKRDTVGTQVDIVPTIMGRLGGNVRHQCWGRDLLALPEGDEGFGIIKPSGGEQSVAIIRGKNILIKSKDMMPRVYEYRLGNQRQATSVENLSSASGMERQLEAFLQVATKSLLENTAGVSNDH